MHVSARFGRFSLVGSILLMSLAAPVGARAAVAAGPGDKLSGTQIGIMPGSLTFPQQQVWTTSGAKTVNVKNTGSTVLNFVSIVASGDYSQTNSCGASLQPAGTCQVTVTFSPSAAGTRTGYITFSDSDPTILQTVDLSGTGAVPASKLTVSPGVASITSAQTEQFSAAFNGVGTSNVTWSVDGVAGGNSTVGTISTAGLYTPPSGSGPHTISAATTQHPSQTASARLVVSNDPGMFSWHNDASLTGQNLNEIVLTTGNVNSTQFGKLFSYTVDGQAYSQTLYVPGVNIPGQGTHNVIYVETQNDSVYAFDADGLTSTPLWHVSFIDPPSVTTISSADVNCTNIGYQVGITSTPVIDPVAGILYVVAATSESTGYVQRLHALDITTGAESLGGPVVISATVPGTGIGSVGGFISFNPLTQEQRAALTLLNGVVYISWASYCDNDPYHGWTMGYNSSTLAQVAVFNSSPNGTRSGTWESGSAAAADAFGNLYVVTGNGTFDASTGGSDYGESYLKFAAASGLIVNDYFTPYDQASDTQFDLDAGSGGPLLLPDQPAPPTHIMVGAGKEGTIYLIDRDSMGGYNPNNNNQILQSLVKALNGEWGAPAFWQNNIYYGGAQKDYLKQFRLYNSLLSTSPIAESANTFKYPGSIPSISANGAADGIVWLIDSSAYGTGKADILYAFDAANVSRELYDTTQAGTRDQAGPAVKFNPPTVANGKVYVGTNGQVDVYGLLP
jgi:hypothetical protein